MKQRLLAAVIGLLSLLCVFLNGVPVRQATPEEPIGSHVLINLSPSATPTPVPTASPRPTWDMAPTVGMDFAELVADNGVDDLPAGYPAADTYRVTVDIAHQVVLVHAKDAGGNYTVPVRYMLCSTGLKNSTPRGTFPLKRYRVRFGLFQNDGTYAQYWTLIRGRIYFHSTLYEERDAATYIEETCTQLGTPASHGCIRLTVPDARFIYYNLAYNTVIEIREGDPLDAETAAIRERLTLDPPPAERLALTRGSVADTDSWRIEDIPLELPYRKGSQKGQK